MTVYLLFRESALSTVNWLNFRSIYAAAQRYGPLTRGRIYASSQQEVVKKTVFSEALSQTLKIRGSFPSMQRNVNA